MKIQELRATLHQQIDQADPSFLQMLHEITEAYNQGEQSKIKEIEKVVIPSSASGSAVTTMQAKAETKKKKKAKNKRLYSLADLEKDMVAW